MLSDNLINAFSWTLIHSVWQGLLLTVATALVISVTRSARPALRYNLLSGLLALFFLVVVATFCRLYFAGSLPVVPAGSGLDATTDTAPVAGSMLLLERVVSFCNQHANLIVFFWFFIFAIRLVKLFVNIGYIQRVRYYGTHEPEGEWIDRLELLAHKMQVPYYVALLESELVKVPSVAGFLKPVILVPVGMLTQLPASQVTAILLHELAHIKRRDYLVNLMQSFVEALFFFNPAVLWLSSLIRDERENCCDDMVVRGGESKKEYINALVSFNKDYAYGVEGRMAMAFPGARQTLVDRVKRMVYNRNRNLSMVERLITLCSLLIICVLPILLLHNDTTASTPHKPADTAITAMPVSDTSGTNTDMRFPDLDKSPSATEVYLSTVTTTGKDGTRYKVVAVGDGRPVFYVNNRAITRESEKRKYGKLEGEMLRELWKRQHEYNEKHKPRTDDE